MPLLIPRKDFEKDAVAHRSNAAAIERWSNTVIERLIGTTSARPGANKVEVGTMFYDTTLSRPVWSDGTNWRDSAGLVA